MISERKDSVIQLPSSSLLKTDKNKNLAKSEG